MQKQYKLSLAVATLVARNANKSTLESGACVTGAEIRKKITLQ
jgi:hypothetical protein